jgi:tetratricopeptide (TPR) repeat protein
MAEAAFAPCPGQQQDPFIPMECLNRPPPAIRWLCTSLLALATCAPTHPVLVHKASTPPPRVARAPRTDSRLAFARRALREGRYEDAEAGFRAALATTSAGEAGLGLAEVLLATGRSGAAWEAARKAERDDAKIRCSASFFGAQALREQGRLGEAEAWLKGVATDPEARRARLLLGEILLESGREQEAEPLLEGLIDDYNQDRISHSNGADLALVGRAAHLLRSPRDANDAYNQAERAGAIDAQTLLWRAELFLQAHDPGHAEEVLRELLKTAPNHAEGLARLAEVKAAQTYDFQAAIDLAEQSLRIRPGLALAYFVLAGVALRDMELEQADRLLDIGLRQNPRALDLLSLRAAVRFLADDSQGFTRVTEAVLALNPRYSRMYQVVGEYADWEHRYDDIIRLMQTAVRLDPGDARAQGELGLNLIRAGDDASGIVELSRAFARDRFNVRVFNTLNLYEQVIPREYVSLERGHFRLRLGRDERAVLDRYLPGWLARGYQVYSRHYGFSPRETIGAEVYPDRDHFSVRTMGLPNVGIQGVSFGRTFAALSPRDQPFNLGMTLLHELAHVFHIQLSRYHVPRWFTEGLAEYETTLARPEWKREHDLELYAALQQGRVPGIQQLNRMFTHARDLGDMTVAYYASGQVLTMLGELHGMSTLARMLGLWGQGRRTPEVFQQAIGKTLIEVDHAYREWQAKRLERYQGQFLPVRPPSSVAEARVAAQAEPKDVRRQVAYGIALLAAGNGRQAAQVAQKAGALAPKHPDVLWLNAQVARLDDDPARAVTALRELMATGHDGYATQMALGTLLVQQRDWSGGRAALEAAHRFDPTQAEPLTSLLRLLPEFGDPDAELNVLRALAGLEQHDPQVYRKLMRALLARNLLPEAIRVGEAALYADVLGLETHLLVAEALERAGQIVRARFELETAVLCTGDPSQLASAHHRLAQIYQRLGQSGRAKKELDKARSLGKEDDEPGVP